MFHVAFRSVHCMIRWGTCQRGTGAFKITSRVAANPETVSSGNVNINIKTSNESLAITPEGIPLRALKPSDSKRGEPETRSTRRLRSSGPYF